MDTESVIAILFEGYYDKRLYSKDGELYADPSEMSKSWVEIIEKLEEHHFESRKLERDEVNMLLAKVSKYGTEAEKKGFFAGFKMACKLLDEVGFIRFITEPR